MDLGILEGRLAELSFFSELREDERLRIAERFELIELAPGTAREFRSADPEMIVILSGHATAIDQRGEIVALFEGDLLGEIDLVTGRSSLLRLTALEPTRIAVLDRRKLDTLLSDFPAVAPPWLAELARETKWRSDLLREVMVAHAERLPPEALEAVLARRRRRLHRRRRGLISRGAIRLVRALVTAPKSRPSFWVLVGALLALAAARTMVALIIREGLQKNLFALIGSEVGHPIHVHHFNYGLLLVSLAGLLALLPRVRGGIKRIAFAFGFGMGLIVDEFALLWNLNPDYYQPLSRLAAGVVLLLLVQVVYFRDLYLALAKRIARVAVRP